MSALVESFFDPSTGTFSYVVHSGDGSESAIIDSVLDYDAASGRTRFDSAKRLIEFINSHRLRNRWILETHVHADHLSAAKYLQQQVGGAIGIGANVDAVKASMRPMFGADGRAVNTAQQFDRLFSADEEFAIGSLSARVLHVPGHTPADVAYEIEDAVFVGDTLFLPERGTARCDFPGGDAHSLYRSARRLLSLPETTRLYLCHDYPEAGATARCETTVAEHRSRNIHVGDGIAEDDFVAMRTTRDATLKMPALILPAVQVNLRGGELPEPEANGIRYLKIPLNSL